MLLSFTFRPEPTSPSPSLAPRMHPAQHHNASGWTHTLTPHSRAPSPAPGEGWMEPWEAGGEGKVRLSSPPPPLPQGAAGLAHLVSKLGSKFWGFQSGMSKETDEASRESARPHPCRLTPPLLPQLRRLLSGASPRSVPHSTRTTAAMQTRCVLLHPHPHPPLPASAKASLPAPPGCSKQQPNAAAAAAAASLSPDHCSNKLPFLLFSFVHRGPPRLQGQVETTFFTGRGWLPFEKSLNPLLLRSPSGLYPSRSITAGQRRLELSCSSRSSANC